MDNYANLKELDQENKRAIAINCAINQSRADYFNGKKMISLVISIIQLLVIIFIAVMIYAIGDQLSKKEKMSKKKNLFLINL